jgi:addiction module RelE/StbE family toxin
MKITFHRSFKKQYKKQPEKIRQEFVRRLGIFEVDPTAEILNVHSLKGEFKAYKSLNVSSDVRALFVVEGEEIIFVKIATHSELYG